MDGNTVGGNSLCANCGWRWNKCIATREESKKVLFMNWVKQYDRPLCWLVPKFALFYKMDKRIRTDCANGLSLPGQRPDNIEG